MKTSKPLNDQVRKNILRHLKTDTVLAFYLESEPSYDVDVSLKNSNELETTTVDPREYTVTIRFREGNHE